MPHPTAAPLTAAITGTSVWRSASAAGVSRGARSSRSEGLRAGRHHHLLDVVAGAERRVGAGDHEAAGRGPADRGLEGVVELERQGVAGVGPVERQHLDVAVAFDAQSRIVMVGTVPGARRRFLTDQSTRSAIIGGHEHPRRGRQLHRARVLGASLGRALRGLRPAPPAGRAAVLPGARSPRCFPQGPGYYGPDRHADVVEASRRPGDFCSGRGGATGIDDIPEEFHEFLGSIINMDDPRHARQRKIVARGFTPRVLDKLKADVERAAVEIVDDIIDQGECDFVTDVAALLPLRIVIDLMGIPRRAGAADLRPHQHHPRPRRSRVRGGPDRRRHPGRPRHRPAWT